MNYANGTPTRTEGRAGLLPPHCRVQRTVFEASPSPSPSVQFKLHSLELHAVPCSTHNVNRTSCRSNEYYQRDAYDTVESKTSSTTTSTAPQHSDEKYASGAICPLILRYCIAWTVVRLTYFILPRKRDFFSISRNFLMFLILVQSSRDNCNTIGGGSQRC